MGTPKRMNFRKSSKRPLTPPLIFGKSYCGFRDKIATKVRMFIMADCCVLYDPISHEMHVVQQFNVVIGCKHTLKKTFCIIFMQKKPYLKSKICNINFWIENDHPPTPFGTFPKIHPFWCAHPSLTTQWITVLQSRVWWRRARLLWMIDSEMGISFLYWSTQKFTEFCKNHGYLIRDRQPWKAI